MTGRPDGDRRLSRRSGTERAHRRFDLDQPIDHHASSPGHGPVGLDLFLLDELGAIASASFSAIIVSSVATCLSCGAERVPTAKPLWGTNPAGGSSGQVGDLDIEGAVGTCGRDELSRDG